MRMLAVTFILFFAYFTFAAPSANECRRFFNYPDGTDKLVAYVESISHLPEVKIHLPEFWNALLSGNAINVISIKHARVNSTLQIHRQGLQDLLNSSYFDMNRLQQLARRKLTDLSSELHGRQTAERQTIVAAVRPHFIRTHQPLPKRIENRTAIVSPYPLEIMNTLVTQNMWVELLALNPSTYFYDEATIQKNGMNVDLRVDSPVESISFWSALFFANEMSLRQGLEPAYDFRGMQFSQLGAASGELMVSDADIEKFFAQNSVEQVVRRSGYRLPTEDEFDLLVQKLKTANGNDAHALSEEQIEDYVWGGEHEAVPPQPVRSKLPFLIDGQPIYDFVGNCLVFTYSPRHNTRGGHSVWAGGRTIWERLVPLKESKSFIRFGTDESHAFISLRLVRSVLP